MGHSLKALKKEVQANGYKSVALTKVATGVGGLDWKDVKPLIESNLGELDVPVYVYETYRRDVQAEEA